MDHPAFRGPSPSTNPEVEAYWEAVGHRDLVPLDFTAEAIASGQPTWPDGTQRFRSVRTHSSVIMATNGLHQLGWELYLEVPNGQGWMYEQITLSWHFSILREVAEVVAATGELGLSTLPGVFLTTSAPAAPPALFIQEEGTTFHAVLVGAPAPQRADTTADGSVLMLALTPLLPQEYQIILSDGAPGAERIAENRAQLGWHHLAVGTEMAFERLGESLTGS